MPQQNNSLIQVRDISYSYAGKPILKNISLDIDKGGIYILRGPSGSGKSTLMRIIAGDILPGAGSVKYRTSHEELMTEDTDFPLFYRSNIGIFFTESLFFEKNSVRDNIYFPSLFGEYQFDYDFFRELIDRLEISPLLHVPMSKVSSGERERIALVRMLVSRPTILFFDEPLSHLDERLFQIGMDVLRDYILGVSPTIFLISHNLELAFDGSCHLSLQNSSLMTTSC